MKTAKQRRQRLEYIYKASIRDRELQKEEKRKKIRNALDTNTLIPTELHKEAFAIDETLPFEGEGGEGIVSPEDDEYRWAGVEDPLVLITTSHNPSSKLMVFAKEMKLMIPNSKKINRASYNENKLIDYARANNYTDVIILQETRGNPDCMIVSHLPYGPTAYFNLTDVVMRCEAFREKKEKISEAFPHLSFNNFSGVRAQRVKDILKNLFPVPKEDSKRVMGFSNISGTILFTHVNYKTIDGKIVATELGPKFGMNIFKILRCTLEEAAKTAEIEWVHRPYMRSAKNKDALGDPIT